MRTWAWIPVLSLLAVSCGEEFTSGSEGSHLDDPDAGAGAGGDVTGGSGGLSVSAGGDGPGTGGTRPGAGGIIGSTGGNGPGAGGDPSSGGAPGSGGTPVQSGGAPGNGGRQGAGGDPVIVPDIPTGGLLLWLRADAGVIQVNGRITVWQDQSGNGSHATQTTPEARPTLETIAMGALPTVLFDGVNDYLDLPAVFSDFSKGLTIFAVANSHANDACPGLFETSRGPELDDVHLGRHEGELQYEVIDNVFRGGTFLPDETRRVSVVHRPTTAVELRQAGGAFAETFINLPAVVDRPFSFVGRTLYEACPTWDGHIGELLVYDRALGDADYATVDGYLAARWGGLVVLPFSPRR